MKQYIVLLVALCALVSVCAEEKQDYAMVWKVGTALRLRVAYVDNSYTTTFDGKEVQNASGNGETSDVFRIDPVLTKGDHTIVFTGVNGPPNPHGEPNPYTFQVYLEDIKGVEWTELKRFILYSHGNTAPSGVVCILTITITGVP